MCPDNDPQDLLDEAERVRSTVRRTRPRTWVPVLLLGVVVALAMPWYVQRPLDEWSGFTQSAHLLVGYSRLTHPTAAAVYWLGALPIAYAAIAAYLHFQGRRRGVRINTAGLARVGAALFGTLVLVTMIAPSMFSRMLPGNLIGRGLLPLVVVSLGLLVWGMVLRRRAVIVVGAVAVAASLISNLYNVANPLLAAGVMLPLEYRLVVNVALTALVLLGGAVVLAVIERG